MIDQTSTSGEKLTIAFRMPSTLSSSIPKAIRLKDGVSKGWLYSYTVIHELGHPGLDKSAQQPPLKSQSSASGHQLHHWHEDFRCWCIPVSRQFECWEWMFMPAIVTELIFNNIVTCNWVQWSDKLATLDCFKKWDHLRYAALLMIWSNMST